jgi:hypothetical protein
VTNVYRAVVQNFVLSLSCNQIYLLNDGTDGFPVIVDGENTGIEGLVCVSCAVTNAQNIISPVLLISLS